LALSGNDIENFRIVKNSHKKHGYQYCVVVKFREGNSIIRRIPDMYATPGTNTIHDEQPAYTQKVYQAAAILVQRLFIDGSLKSIGCKYRSCRQAMSAFETERNRDHHGNSFKEFFGDMPLSDVPDSVDKFIEWLCEKYHNNEATVSKKAWSASAMFRWLIKTKQWNSKNPFHNCLDGFKFAPRKRLKSIIEPSEYEKLKEVMRADRYKELRIVTGIMFYTGMRPSEASEVEANNIDPERLTLTYLRTKRKNKTPDWRRIPIPRQLLMLLINEDRTDGKVVRCGKSGIEQQMREAVKECQIGGLTMKTFRKDFAIRARMAGASKDDLNLIQGRDEGVLEKNYTTDEWFIVHQCRPWIDRMYGDGKTVLRVVK